MSKWWREVLDHAIEGFLWFFVALGFVMASTFFVVITLRVLQVIP